MSQSAENDAPQPSTVALPAGGFCGGHPDCDDPRCRVTPPAEPTEAEGAREAVLHAMRLLREADPSPAALAEIERIEREHGCPIPPASPVPDPAENDVPVAIKAQNPDLETAWRTIAWWEQTCAYWQAEAQKGYALRDSVIPPASTAEDCCPGDCDKPLSQHPPGPPCPPVPPPGRPHG